MCFFLSLSLSFFLSKSIKKKDFKRMPYSCNHWTSRFNVMLKQLSKNQTTKLYLINCLPSLSLVIAYHTTTFSLHWFYSPLLQLSRFITFKYKRRQGNERNAEVEEGWKKMEKKMTWSQSTDEGNRWVYSFNCLL